MTTSMSPQQVDGSAGADGSPASTPGPGRTVRNGPSPVATAAVVVAGTGGVAVFDPTSRHVPLCPLRAVTGLDCPFCGGLRSVWSLTRGRVGDALDHNLLVTLSIPLLVAGWVWWFLRWRRDAPSSAVPTGLKVGVVSLLVVFAVLRNLPAFAWLDSSS